MRAAALPGAAAFFIDAHEQDDSLPALLDTASDRIATAAISGGGLLMIGSLVLIFILIVSEALPLFAPPKTALHGKLARSRPRSAGGRARTSTADAVELLDARRHRSASSTLADGKHREGASGPRHRRPHRHGSGPLDQGRPRARPVGRQRGRREPDVGVYFRRRGVRRVDLEREGASPPRARPGGARAHADRVRARRNPAPRSSRPRPRPDALFFGVASSEAADAFSRGPLRDRSEGETVTALSFLDNGSVALRGHGVRKDPDAFPLEDPKAPGATEVDGRERRTPAPITALETLVGGQTLVAGDAKGRVTGLLRVRDRRRRRGPDAAAPSKTFDGRTRPRSRRSRASGRGKTFVTGDAEGQPRRPLRNERAHARARTRVDGPVVGARRLAEGGQLRRDDRRRALTDFTLDAPHPEISFARALRQAALRGLRHARSTSGSRAAARTTSSRSSRSSRSSSARSRGRSTRCSSRSRSRSRRRSTRASSRRRASSAFVKPIVEIMAALPSVVLGFLAGLWLAPLIQKATLSTLLLVPSIPLFVLARRLPFQLLPFEIRQHLHPGQELFLVLPLAVLATGFACVRGPLVEKICSSRATSRPGSSTSAGPEVRRAQLASSSRSRWASRSSRSSSRSRRTRSRACPST